MGHREISELEIDDIMKGLVNSSTRLAELIRTFTEEELSKKVKIESPWFQCDKPKYGYLMQVINHGTYHRGQIVPIGRNIWIAEATNTDNNSCNMFTNN